MTTNVRPEELNYSGYEQKVYDKEIKLVIPGHTEMHNVIEAWVLKKALNGVSKILELGIGTGLTSERILKNIPKVDYTVIDFSSGLMEKAIDRLKNYNTHFIYGDFSKVKFSGKYDIVVSVIGIHHQDNFGKKKLFKKIFNSLNMNGIFIFGDLITYRDPFEAALNDAKHYHSLVENMKDKGSLRLWAHHHKFLNILATLEDQISWLKEAGFGKVEVLYKKFNTALIVAKKI